MAAARPAVLARRRCEATSPTKAQPSCPTLSCQLVSSVEGISSSLLTGLTSIIPERPEADNKDHELLERLRVLDLAEDAYHEQRYST